MDRYQEILFSLFTRFPSVQKEGFGSASYKPGLQHMLDFDKALGSPSIRLKTIHVAGTNGKGSVSSMLASCLAAEGYRVGLFTSPHLVDFRERMRIVEDGGTVLIPKEKVLDFIGKWSPVFDSLDLSFFEITTGMAISWFVEEDVDIAVMEVGLGGRLDSTNIIVPELSVITSIGLDHCAQLGGTRALIAGEKAGIFKPGVPALVWGVDEETLPVFEDRAQTLHCPLFFADEYVEECGLEIPDRSGYDLPGEYQESNVTTVLAALDILGFEADVDALRNTAARSGLRGRWEKLCSSPTVICDIGHNPPALERNFGQLRKAMESGNYSSLIIVYGVMADKALSDIIPLMPHDAEYVFVTPDTPRALPSREIEARFSAAFPDAASSSHSTVAEGLAYALTSAPANALVYVGGSTFVVSEAIKYFENEKL